MSGMYERLQKLSQKQLASLVMELQAQAEASKAVEKDDDIAVVGLGCRFPGGANSPEEFWNLLREGVDAVSVYPTERWDSNDFLTDSLDEEKEPVKGGFLKNVDIAGFDAAFFGIGTEEAKYMDPQQRLTLEVTWEALEYGGIIPNDLAESKTGVFMGVSGREYDSQQEREEIGSYSALGTSYSSISGRISFLLGLEGPSMTIDTACSSSLVAVHQACESLKRDECSLAIAGGVNLMLSPDSFHALSEAKMLSKDGKCKTFDDAADGYVRGEGCGVVILKRKQDALRDQNEILAVIKGSAVNHNGRSGSLTAPKGSLQSQVIKDALQRAHVTPKQISYIEAHGTGTALGDLIELQALGEVFQKEHSQEDPLYIGSVKTNIGHLEAASGIAGLIKVILAFSHKEIPAHINFTKMNSHISLEDIHGKIAIKPTKWESKEKRTAGVSSFGFTGTNAHVILQEKEENETVASPDKHYYFASISAKTNQALTEYLEHVKEYIRKNPEVSAKAIASECTHYRSNYKYRMSFCLDDKKPLKEQFCENYVGTVSKGESAKAAFVYTDKDCFWSGLGKNLYDNCDVFRETFDETGKVFEELSGFRLMDVIEDGGAKLNSLQKQAVMYLLQYALTKQWEVLDVKPYCVYGEGFGKWSVLCQKGKILFEDGMRQILDGVDVDAWLAEKDLENSEIFLSQKELITNGTNVIIQIGLPCHDFLPNMKQLTSFDNQNEEYKQMIKNLCECFVLGVPFHTDSIQLKEPVLLNFPTYPYQRERLWVGFLCPEVLEEVDKSALSKAVLEERQKIEREVSQQFDQTKQETGSKKLECLCVENIRQVFRRFGAFQDEFITITEFMEKCGIKDSYRALITGWMEQLVAKDVLMKEGDRFGNLRESKVYDEKEMDSILSDEAFASSCALVMEFQDKIQDILLGKMEAQSVLFADGSHKLLDDIYRDNAISRFYNAAVKRILQSLLELVPKSKKIRILELGAGTGSLTQEVLPQLPKERTEYCFTDVSQSFLSKAKESFKEYPFVSYQLFDLNQSIEEQGLAKNSFDVVLASNVMHATKNIWNSIEQVKDLLAPEGYFIFIELTKATMFFDTTFKLTLDRIEDPVYRPDGETFLSADKWKAALEKQGFYEIGELPERRENGQMLGQHVIVAKKEKQKDEKVWDAFFVTQHERTSGENVYHGKADITIPKTIEELKEREGKEEEKQDISFLEKLKNVSQKQKREMIVSYLKDEVIELLGYSTEDVLEEEVSLVELGIDSLMLIDLRVLLEAKLGISFPAGTFYSNASISSLAEYLEKELGKVTISTDSVEQMIAAHLKPVEEDRYVPFPLSDVQKAYITPYKETGMFLMTGGYYQFECQKLNVDAFVCAIERLVETYDILRVVLVDENRQVVMEETPEYEMDIVDLRGKSSQDAEKVLEEANNRSSYAVCGAGMWPIFDCKAFLLEDKTILGIFLPGMLMDAVGVQLFFEGLKTFYYNPNANISVEKLSFRNYLLETKKLEGKEELKECKKYWNSQIRKMPPYISLPMTTKEPNIEQYQYKTRIGKITKEDWDECKKKAAKLGITPSGFVCASLLEVLHQWSGQDAFAINAMAYNRFLPYDGINKIMANMSSTMLLFYDVASGSSDERKIDLQKQIFDGLSHRYISSTQMLRENNIESSYLLPVMYDSLIGVVGNEDTLDWIGKTVCERFERHPEALDCQSFENPSGDLVVKWDTADVLLGEKKVDQMFEAFLLEIKG